MFIDKASKIYQTYVEVEINEIKYTEMYFTWNIYYKIDIYNHYLYNSISQFR